MRSCRSGALVAALLVSTAGGLARADEPFRFQLSLAPDIAVLSASAVGLLLPTVLQADLIHPYCPCRAAGVNALDRTVIGNHSPTADALSNVSVVALPLLPLGLDALDVGISRTLLEDTVVYGEALAVSGALVTITKTVVQRPRPYLYASQARGGPSDYTSFYSGHTTLVFSALTAAATTYELRHGASAWPWVLTAVLGASVAAERVLAGKHFYTDVLVGAATGAATGVLVPWLHAPRQQGWHLSAGVLPGGAGLALTHPL